MVRRALEEVRIVMSRTGERARIPVGLTLAAAAAAFVLATSWSPPARASAVCGVIDSPCTLEDIVIQALADEPGTEVVKAGFTARHLSDGSEVTLYKVVVRAADGMEHVLYYNAADCQRVIPPVPVVSFLEAHDAAVAAAVAAAPGLAPALVLSGSLRHELLEPTWVFEIIDPQQELVVAKVDALDPTAVVELGEPSSSGNGNGIIKKKKGKAKIAQSLFDCDDADSDSDSDSDSDGDSDSDSVDDSV
jgi:hypothetical protein